MSENRHQPIAIVGLGAILPDAPDVPTFWHNLRKGRYSITETPPERWDPAAYWDPDPRAPDRTYSKIGGWVRDFDWDPLAWRLPIPPKVGEAMDLTQKWAVAAARQALADFGWPERPLDRERTAVVLGNAMGGDRHYLTAARLLFPEFARGLASTPGFAALSGPQRETISAEYRAAVGTRFPEITEDTMPGELANIIAGRVANLFDLHGPNFVCDAACASALAAIGAAIEALDAGDCDAVLTGGIDANMSASTFIKFCKIGALSATGTRPYADGADGFVMGEGAAVFLLKRLADALRDGDRIYSVLLGIGGASDGRGKGITAPNPVGQRLAIERAWAAAGESPATVGLIEGHGTSTKVGDLVEIESLVAAFGGRGMAVGSVPLGSVKSNFGHLKGAAGAAGLLKATLALHHREIPPSLHCEQPNPAIDFAKTPFYVPGDLRPWERSDGTPRRACVSAFGFGGTNFHAVLEEWEPGRSSRDRRSTLSVSASSAPPSVVQPPLRGALVVGAETEAELAEKLGHATAAARTGQAPDPARPHADDLAAPLRLVIDYGDAGELAVKSAKAIKALAAGPQTGMWRALKSQGIHRGAGAPAKIAFLYTGQGSQYVNMLGELRAREPIVARTFEEADAVLYPLLGKSLSEILFVPPDDAESVAACEAELRKTAITQPAVLTVDVALTRLMAAYGVVPDFVMGHSLGEYGALVAAECLSFEQALEAVSARGREMTRISVDDNGSMVAVFGPLAEIESVLTEVDGYAVVANINSRTQAVVGGETGAVERATALLTARGFECRPLPVSHAFHTRIVAAASAPLREMLERLDLRPPRIPIVSNATGELYPMGGNVVPAMIDLLARQIAEPVQFVRGLETLHEQGARVFVEVGPRRALQGFVEEVLGARRDILGLHTNHPKSGDIVSFNAALCGIYASGRGDARDSAARPTAAPSGPLFASPSPPPRPATEPARAVTATAMPALTTDPSTLTDLGRVFADFLERGFEVYQRGGGAPPATRPGQADPAVVVTGAALGLPGTDRVFDDANIGRLLAGEQMIHPVPELLRQKMVGKRITRLVKSDEGGARFEVIESPDEVIKLAARAGEFDPVAEFGFPADRVAAWDRVTSLAIGAGIDALRDAGIPLVQRYKTTTTGGRLRDRWGLSDDMRDSTGVIFASAFPGLDRLVGQVEAFHLDHARRERLAELRQLAERAEGALAEELRTRTVALEESLKREPYAFDRRFLFHVLAMGHSQFAEAIGARGPNTQINSACASTTQAVGLASDWLRTGRCRRVVVISADDITTDTLLPWFASGFLASGAAATDELVEDAALPFDRRRHGLLIGMGAAALVIETADAARERGIAPICEVLSSVTANSAFHGSRLDIVHIRSVMERLIADAETRWGLDRHAIAGDMVFVSHETYTPARGGSAQAEIDALRAVFGASADSIVIANTKGYTGHPMGVGIEDVVAVKSLETGLVPPVPNLREVDPELGELHLSRGGRQPVRFALRLGAGFGSQISMTLQRWVAPPDGRRRDPDELGYAYRIADPAAWSAWLAQAGSEPEPELEVVRRTLRLVDRSAARSPGARDVAPTLRVAATETAQPAVQTPVAASAPIEPVPVPEGGPDAEPDPVRERVLALVAEQTGYPAEMLALDLDLEADLGIDTVKQAELFAAVREEWGIERDPDLKLREFNTLAKTIEFVYAHRPELRDQVGETALRPLPVVPAAAAPITAVAGPSPFDGGDEVVAALLEIVSAQTGYPAEMLEPDLDLEADLGIDTVKQAEIFAAVRERYGIERDPDLKLKEFNTLAKTAAWVRSKRAPTAESPTPTVAVEPSPATPLTPLTPVTPVTPISPVSPETPVTQVTQVGPADVPRRVTTIALRPPLDRLEATGVELAAGDRVVLATDGGGVAERLTARLRQRGVEVLSLRGAPAAADLERQIAGWRDTGPVRGLYWLAALDPAPPLERLVLAGWREALRVRAKLLAVALRALDESLSSPGAFVIAGTRLGGHHGAGPEGPDDALGGAVSGLVKAFQREHPEILVKAVDFEPSAPDDRVAERLVFETLADPGVVEIGWRGSNRVSLALAEEDSPGTDPDRRLGSDSVFVVTGAAGSIVSAILRDLAATGGSYHLLDLAPEPDPGDPDLALFQSDRDGLKRALFERLGASGERITPVRVERELASIERRAEALAAMAAITANGGHVQYHQVDLRDDDAVAAALATLRDGSRRIDVLLHAAGLEISKRLVDKPQEEFDRVFDVKADGWFNLLAALGSTPIGAAVVFSSIAGRFGNAGQTDYAAANELVAKSVAQLAARRPGTRGIVLDWTGWATIGMASRGSIPQLLAAAGIDLLPPEIGIATVRREIEARGSSREVVVAGRLGALLEAPSPAGGLDLSGLDAALAGAGPMIGEVLGFDLHRGLAVEVLLDPAEQPFLDHHRIGGTPVLPGVMGIEGFGEIAGLLYPDRPLLAIEAVRFLAPFKFFRDEPRRARITARFEPSGEQIVAHCRLEGERILPGQTEPQRTLQFSARVLLGAPGSEAPHPVFAAERAAAILRAAKEGLAVGSDEIYKIYFHGPAYQVIERVRRNGDGLVGESPANLPAEATVPTRFLPRAIELAFQTAGIADLARTGRMALPSEVAAIRFGARREGPPWLAAVERDASGSARATVLDRDGRVVVELEGYRTIDLPEALSAEEIAALGVLSEVEP